MTHEDVLPRRLREELEGRHEATRHLGQFFTYEHLRGHARLVCRQHAEFLLELLVALPDDGPELSAGLRKLLEVKDCLVRQAILSYPAARREESAEDG